MVQFITFITCAAWLSIASQFCLAGIQSCYKTPFICLSISVLPFREFGIDTCRERRVRGPCQTSKSSSLPNLYRLRQVCLNLIQSKNNIALGWSSIQSARHKDVAYIEQAQRAHQQHIISIFALHKRPYFCTVYECNEVYMFCFGHCVILS